ncbi:MAG: serine/threonine protein kinase [Deltaproteobacteria bacterium]|nr:serine/threonine protein kinase [Deltaproteobacteria bacterium]
MSSGVVQAVWCCSTCGAIYHKDFPRCPNDGGEVVVAETDPMLGKTIGRYVIDRFVGEGGMGRVYEAHHATLANKRYAVKVLLGDAGATPSMRKRFAKEAESASRLVHPNVVGVIDYGATDGGLPYIVMDFVDGRSIAELIDDGPMPVARALRLVRAICDGLAYAHEAGVVHRDLKPANILIVTTSEGDEVPRIADFGLAQTAEESDVRLTSTGMAMGTPAYAAPEQMAGKRVDHRADLYALGMTMFEMLSGGELPFKGGPMDVATEKAHREAPPFSEVCPAIAIPPALEQLLAGLLKRRAQDRIASSADAIAAIDQIVLGLAVDERAATVNDPRRRTPVPARRAVPGRWIVPALVGAIAAVGGAAWIVSSHRAPADKPVVAAAEIATPPAPAPPIVDPPHAPAAAPEPLTAPAAAPAPVAKVAPTRPHKHHDEKPPKAVAQAVHIDPTPVQSPPAAPSAGAPAVTQPLAPVVVAPTPPAPVPAPPPPAPLPIHAAIAAVDVHGSLPAADVRRAVDRALPAIEHCSPAAAQNVVAELTIGENRRAEGVRASGGSAANCVSSALSSVRTESAPDVGEVEVTVHVKFAEQK